MERVVGRRRALDRLVDDLLRSAEPSVRWKTRVGVLGESRDEPRVARLEQEIRDSPRVRALRSHEKARSVPNTARSVYYKWQGTHWVLAALADLGYPRGDPDLVRFRDRVLSLWLRASFYRTYEVRSEKSRHPRPGVPVIRGRARRCASQQGNALHYLTTLEIGDHRLSDLARLLEGWQWPDGGWNCDKRPAADTSSFMETLTPMRGLAIFGDRFRDASAREASRRAAEVFLTRSMFRRRRDGSVIDPRFQQLHYPTYWRYDILAGLKGLAEAHLLNDPRASEALDWLESRALPDGGWPADARFFRYSTQFRPGSEFVHWGRGGPRDRNEWVTVDALRVLREARRIEP